MELCILLLQPEAAFFIGIMTILGTGVGGIGLFIYELAEHGIRFSQWSL